MNLIKCSEMLRPRTHAAKRRSVIEAAATVFCREGFGGANIDLIAAEAGVSRQTVYNHHGDKDKLFDAVVHEITAQCNARAYAALETFPDQPCDLEAELTAFAMRMNKTCFCSHEGNLLRKLIFSEGERHPELFEVWYTQGPGAIEAGLAARFARLAYSGYLDIDDPDVAARQFLALSHADIKLPALFGKTLSDAELLAAARSAVRTFMRAFGRKSEQPAVSEAMHA